MCLNATRKAREKVHLLRSIAPRFRNRARADLERFQRRGSRVMARARVCSLARSLALMWRRDKKKNERNKRARKRRRAEMRYLVRFGLR